MRRKKGRRSRRSRVESEWISVRTQCSCQRLVTKSRSESTSGKVRPRVPFSSDIEGRRERASSEPPWARGTHGFCGRWRRRKWWCWTRYSAIECLPAQIPFFHRCLRAFCVLSSQMVRFSFSERVCTKRSSRGERFGPPAAKQIGALPIVWISLRSYDKVLFPRFSTSGPRACSSSVLFVVLPAVVIKSGHAASFQAPEAQNPWPFNTHNLRSLLSPLFTLTLQPISCIASLLLFLHQVFKHGGHL